MPRQGPDHDDCGWGMLEDHKDALDGAALNPEIHHGVGRAPLQPAPMDISYVHVFSSRGRWCQNLYQVQCLEPEF